MTKVVVDGVDGVSALAETRLGCAESSRWALMDLRNFAARVI